MVHCRIRLKIHRSLELIRMKAPSRWLRFQSQRRCRSIARTIYLGRRSFRCTRLECFSWRGLCLRESRRLRWVSWWHRRWRECLLVWTRRKARPRPGWERAQRRPKMRTKSSWSINSLLKSLSTNNWNVPINCFDFLWTAIDERSIIATKNVFMEILTSIGAKNVAISANRWKRWTSTLTTAKIRCFCFRTIFEVALDWKLFNWNYFNKIFYFRTIFTFASDSYPAK